MAFIAANGADLVDSTAGIIIPMAAGVPAALTISTDTAFAFSQSVAHVYIQNKSATAVYVAFDVAATVGSLFVPANGILNVHVPCSVLHLFSAAATNVNGAADLNIVALGWL